MKVSILLVFMFLVCAANASTYKVKVQCGSGEVYNGEFSAPINFSDWKFNCITQSNGMQLASLVSSAEVYLKVNGAKYVLKGKTVDTLEGSFDSCDVLKSKGFNLFDPLVLTNERDFATTINLFIVDPDASPFVIAPKINLTSNQGKFCSMEKK